MRERLRRWGIPWFMLLLVIIASGSAGVVAGTSSSKFCGICHIMRPQEATWQASAHSKVACATCHVEPGINNAIRHQMEILRRLYLVATKRYLLPVEIQHTVSNEVCLACHTFARTVTPRNDIVVPHAEHIEAGVNCVDCHQGVAHGRTAQRGMTIDGNFERWTPQLGVSEMVPENLRISMNGCITCHKKRGKKLPTQCEGCHTKIVEPLSHKNEQVWLFKHGLEAVRDLAKCDECHNYTNVSQHKLSGDELDITQYPRKNTFCSNCHLQRPAQHSATWLHDHSEIARYDAKMCLVCHSIQEPNSWEKSTKTYCSQCHQGNLGSAFFNQ